VALRAFVDSRGRGAPAPQEIRWTSSLDGELGFGRELVAQLGEGRHEITATAPDGIGGSLAERGIIIVSGNRRASIRVFSVHAQRPSEIISTARHGRDKLARREAAESEYLHRPA
jgi:hypothetical protein